jgi:hypothetical protein
MSTPERKCIGLPEQKYISDADKKAPELGAFSPSPMAVGDLDKNGELLGLAHATAESISVSHNRPTLDIVYLTR